MDFLELHVQFVVNLDSFYYLFASETEKIVLIRKKLQLWNSCPTRKHNHPKGVLDYTKEPVITKSKQTSWKQN